MCVEIDIEEDMEGGVGSAENIEDEEGEQGDSDTGTCEVPARGGRKRRHDGNKGLYDDAESEDNEPRLLERSTLRSGFQKPD